MWLLHVPAKADGVLRIAVFPKRAAMNEENLWIFLSKLQNERPIAERCAHHDLRAIDLDHAFHHTLGLSRFRNALLFDKLHARQLAYTTGRHSKGLIESVVIARCGVEKSTCCGFCPRSLSTPRNRCSPRQQCTSRSGKHV